MVTLVASSVSFGVLFPKRQKLAGAHERVLCVVRVCGCGFPTRAVQCFEGCQDALLRPFSIAWVTAV